MSGEVKRRFAMSNFPLLALRMLLLTLAVPSASGQFSSLAAASYHTCGLLLYSGYASCWGYNYDGELGIDTSGENMLSPVYPTGGHTFSSLAAGWYHTCGVAAPGGAAYCWGRNGQGQLGDGTQEFRTDPTPVSGGRVFSGLTGGEFYSCGVETSSGAAFCWGNNDYGQLGYSTTQVYDEWNDHNYEFSTEPGAVSGGYNFSSLAAGWYHTCGILASTGAAICWGYNSHGELGDGTTTHRREPAPVSGGLAFSILVAGHYHTCGLVKTTGAAFCWGYNADGELGDGTGDDRSAPVEVSGGRSYSILAAGQYHTCGLVASTGLAFCWGNNDHAQMGDTTTGTSRHAPVEVSGGHVFSALSAGWYHACGAASSSGAVWCWGHNEEGELGDGTTSMRLAPVSLSTLPSLSSTPSSSSSSSVTLSSSQSKSQTSSPLVAASTSSTPSDTSTPSATSTHSASPTSSQLVAASTSSTPSETSTPSATSTHSASPTPSQTLSQGFTASQSATASKSGTQGTTGSPTQASTQSETQTPSGTWGAPQSVTTSQTVTPSESASSQASTSISSATASLSLVATYSQQSSGSSSAFGTSTASASYSLSRGASSSQTSSVTPSQSTSVVFAVVQIGVGITVSGGLTPEVLTMPMVGVHLRSGLACIANVSLASVTISSIAIVNGSTHGAAVPLPPSHPVNTATNVSSSCGASNDRRLSPRVSGKAGGAKARTLAGGSFISLDVGLTISVSVPSTGFPQSSAPVNSVLAALAPMLNASASNFSSGGSGVGSGGASVAVAFASFATAAATAAGSDPAAFQIGVSAQTAVLAVPSMSPTPSQSSPSAPAGAASTTAELSGGAVTGIVVGCVVTIILIVVVAVLVSRRTKSSVMPRKGAAAATPVAADGGASRALGNVDNASAEPRFPPTQPDHAETDVVREVQP